MPRRAARRRPSTALAALAALAAASAAPAIAQTAETGGEITVSHGISAFGELKYPADFKHFDYVNPDAPKGGTWSGRGTGASNTFDSLNPFILKGEAAQGLGSTWDSMLTASADEPDAEYGVVAHTIEYPEDRAWVIFRMRPEARYSDGTPLTAHDAVWTFETLRDKASPSIRLRLRDVASAEALDDHTVKYVFAEGVPTRDLPSLVGSLPIMSRAWWETRNFEDSTLEPILGSGPYRVGEVKPGRSIVYERRDDYWGKDLPVNVGANNFDRFVFEYFKDYTASFEAFKAGAFLFHEEFFSKIWATGYDFPALKKGWVKREQVADSRPSGTQGFWFNMRRPIFQDTRVRQALAMGFDFEWSNEKLFYSLYTRTTSFFSNSPMAAEGMPSPEELALLEPLREHLPESVFAEEAYLPPVTNGSGSDRRVLRRAMKLLDEAGWKVDGKFRKNAAGETLKVEILDDSPTFQRIIGPYVENLKKMGVDASLRIVDPAQYQARVEKRDYDVIPGRFVMSFTPGPSMRNLFGSDAADQEGTANLTGIANPAIDALLEHLISAGSRDEVNTAARALDRALRAMHIWTPNWYKDAWNIAYWDVYGKPENPAPYSRGDAYWWWDEEKATKLRAEGAL